MKLSLSVLVASIFLLYACEEPEPIETDGILGYELLEDINGHWVGRNQTPYGLFEWFTFDFRPISSSHSHSIYEGATNQNIINSVFLADIDGEQKIVARNGGWLGGQYRATYFVLDIAQQEGDEKYYRLVDAVGGEKRSFIEFRLKQDSLLFDAYKDNSGSLDEPVIHMSFKGANRNPSYSAPATTLFDYPSKDSEVNLNNAFANLVDPDSALFLEEADDPFPKSAHGHISELHIDITRDAESTDQDLLFFISKEELISSTGQTNLQNIDNSVVRTIDIRFDENEYTATYLHPDDYYLTVFWDSDGNGFPSSGDHSSVSVRKEIGVEVFESDGVEIGLVVE